MADVTMFRRVTVFEGRDCDGPSVEEGKGRKEAEIPDTATFCDEFGYLKVKATWIVRYTLQSVLPGRNINIK